jgi:23S rRNA pseudouridine955/2504/2580 synthase
MEAQTVAPDEAGMRLDRWFKAHYPNLSFSHLQKLVRSGQIRVNGGRARTSTRLEPGQTVRVPPLEPARGEANRRSSPWPAGSEGAPAAPGATGSSGRKPAGLTAARLGRGSGVARRPRRDTPIGDADFLRSILLHEDDDVFVFNKPPGLATQGGSGLTRHIDGMLGALRDKKGHKPRLVHRLDRDTSGVLVVARTRLAAQKLAQAFRSRSTRKVYWALVRGVPKPRQGRISTWLAKRGGPEGDRMRIARHGADDASHAVTHYSVVDHAGQKLAWLTLRPVTGRTHQLRAHAAHIGHPIVGDAKYFDADEWELPGGMQNKLHLHARRIVIPHPAGGTLDLTAPLPAHMEQSWNLLGLDAAAGDDGEDQPEP